MPRPQIPPETRREQIVKMLPVVAIVAVAVTILVLRPVAWSNRSFGLWFDFLGAMIMAAALFKPERVIRSMATVAGMLGSYTDPEAVIAFRRDKYLGLYGMSLMATGFLLQLL